MVTFRLSSQDAGRLMFALSGYMVQLLTRREDYKYKLQEGITGRNLEPEEKQHIHDMIARTNADIADLNDIYSKLFN